MPGLAAYYLIKEKGEYLPIVDYFSKKDFELFLNAGHREWLEAKYRTYNYRPISLSFKSFVPYGPCHKDTLRIALIMFASNLFDSCPSMGLVRKEMEGIESVDFNFGRDVPKHFDDLLEESRTVNITSKIEILQVELHEVRIDENRTGDK